MDIQVNQISKIYGSGENRVTALNQAAMTIRAGDFLSIMGPSGSGKSTLLHIISGLDRPTSGTVTYGSTDIHHGTDRELSAFRRQKIGFIFQQFNLLPVLTQCCQLNNKFLDIDYFRRTCYTFTCLRISNSILYKQHL